MKVWLVFVESDEYESYSRDVEAVFETEKMADSFASACGGDVVEWDVLDSAPTKVWQHIWNDRILPDGTLSPTWTNGKFVYEHFGRSRHRWKQWSSTATTLEGKLSEWTGSGAKDGHIEVRGIDLEQVKAEHKRLIALYLEQQH